MKNLYYFRNDFRLQDNELLQLAIKSSDEIVFVAKKKNPEWGFWRQKFYDESLGCLSEQLEEKGHQLFLISDNEWERIQFSDFDKLFTPLIPTTYERQELAKLKREIPVHTQHNDRLLKSIPYQSPNELPDIFTEFRKKIEKKYIPDLPYSITGPWPKPVSLQLDVFKKVSYSKPHPDSAFPFRGGERSAKERLEQYFFFDRHILTYKKTRNGMVGLEYSTKFSPFLALGCLSSGEVYREVERFEKEVKSNQDTYWVKFELWWREYFRWVYEKYQDRIFYPTGLKSKELNSEENEDLFQNWVNGNTGDDFVDANMIELKETGWMSNRGRQNVASYLVKDLNLPWIWGAQHFEKNLIDYDVFSNWGNWQYVSGVGNDPRPNRYFNTEKQAGMYDANSEFRNLWLTRSAKNV